MGRDGSEGGKEDDTRKKLLQLSKHMRHMKQSSKDSPLFKICFQTLQLSQKSRQLQKEIDDLKAETKKFLESFKGPAGQPPLPLQGQLVIPPQQNMSTGSVQMPGISYPAQACSTAAPFWTYPGQNMQVKCMESVLNPTNNLTYNSLRPPMASASFQHYQQHNVPINASFVNEMNPNHCSLPAFSFPQAPAQPRQFLPSSSTLSSLPTTGFSLNGRTAARGAFVAVPSRQRPSPLTEENMSRKTVQDSLSSSEEHRCQSTNPEAGQLRETQSWLISQALPTLPSVAVAKKSECSCCADEVHEDEAISFHNYLNQSAQSWVNRLGTSSTYSLAVLPSTATSRSGTSEPDLTSAKCRTFEESASQDSTFSNVNNVRRAQCFGIGGKPRARGGTRSVSCPTPKNWSDVEDFDRTGVVSTPSSSFSSFGSLPDCSPKSLTSIDQDECIHAGMNLNIDSSRGFESISNQDLLKRN